MKKYYTTLTIAGSDCSGGAGIQADLKTFSAIGCYGLSVITALTAQNTLGVQEIYPIPANFVKSQIDSVFQDISINALKIGMLDNAEIIETVAERLRHYNAAVIVLDPVMVSKNGNALLRKKALTTLQQKLFPLTTLLTPNIQEAELLLQFQIRDKKNMELAARQLCEQGPAAVLIKGGHFENNSESNDCLYLKATHEWHWFTASRIDTHHTHGTGCTLSAAITAYLAKKQNLVSAVSQAKHYITQAINSGKDYTLGKGQGPVDHFFAAN